MHRFLFVLLFSILLLNISVCAHDNKMQKFSLFESLPKRTLIIMGMPDIDKTRKVFTETNLYRLLNDPKIAKFAQPFLKMIEPHLEKGFENFKKQTGFTVEEALSIFSGEVMAAIVDFNFANRRNPASAVLSVEAGPHIKIACRFFDFVKRTGKVKFQKSIFQGFPVYQMVKGPLVYGIIGNTFLFSNNLSLLKEIISNHINKKKTVLLKNDEIFKNIVKNLVPEGQICNFRLYVNVENIFKTLNQLIPFFPLQIIDTLGLNDIKSISFTFNTGEKTLQSIFYIYAPGSHKGIHKLYRNTPVNIELAATKVPVDALAFSSCNFDLVHFINGIEDILKDVDKNLRTNLFNTYKMYLGVVENKLKFKIKEDFAAVFKGDACSVAFFPKAGGLLALTVSIFNINDEEKALNIINTLAKLCRLDIKTVKFDDQEIFYFSTPLGKFGTNPFKYLKLQKNSLEGFITIISTTTSGTAFLIKDGNLYFARSAHGLIEYLEWAKTDKTALSGDESFMKKVKNKQYLFFFYLNPQQGIQKWYNTFIILLRTFEGQTTVDKKSKISQIFLEREGL